MIDKGRSTPAQQEHKKESGWPVPLLFIVVVAVIMAAIVFGPSLMAGMSESSAADTTNSGGSGTDGAGTGTDSVAVDTKKPDGETGADTVGEIGKYYPITNLPKEISSEKRPDMNLVNIRIENNILKFSIIKNDDDRFSNVRYHAVDYRVKVIAYRGEPYNREITYSFLSDRLRLERWQKENIEGDLSLLELQSADHSSGKPQKTSCEIRQVIFYFE